MDVLITQAAPLSLSFWLHGLCFTSLFSPVSSACIERTNRDVTASYFNKRQKAIRCQHRLCWPHPVKLTFVRHDCRRHVENHQRIFQLCNVTAVMLACMLMLISPAWQRLTSPSSMAWRVRAPRETQGPNMSECWADLWAVLTPR